MMSDTNGNSVPMQQTANLRIQSERRPVLGKDGIQLAIATALIVLMVMVPSWIGSGYWTYVAQIVSLYIAVAALQNILFVDAGQMSFGQGSIFGLAAYVAGAASGLYGLPYGVAMVLGVAAAALAGLLFALPALRVQGFHLGFITLSAAVVFPELVVALDRYTNGVNGVVVSLFGFFDRTQFGVSVLSLLTGLFAIGAIALHVWLRATKLGRAMRVAAASPECSQSLGIHPGLMRSIAFLIAAVGTGLAGVLYPPVVGFIGPDAFLLDLSILFFFSVIVGGRGEPLAPVLGIIILYLLPNVFLAGLTEYRLLAYGVIVLLVMLFFPNGVVGSLIRWLESRGRTESEAGAIPIDLVLSDLAAPAPPGGDVVLKVQGARKNFGRVAALTDVNFELRRGEVHGLVGANGSGKTSLLNVLTGFSRLDSGNFSIRGKRIERLPPHRISRMGVGRTFQTPRIFPFFTTWENVEIGLDGRSSGGTSRNKAHDLIRSALAARTAEWLPHGQRRLVEIMRVVLKDADILLLDEPAAGLSPGERAEFSKLLRNLATVAGKAIVLVEHDLQLVWGVADRITVLEAGRTVAAGAPEEVRRNPAVHHLFVGEKNA